MAEPTVIEQLLAYVSELSSRIVGTECEWLDEAANVWRPGTVMGFHVSEVTETITVAPEEPWRLKRILPRRKVRFEGETNGSD